MALVILVHGLWFMLLGSSCEFMMLTFKRCGASNNNHMHNLYRLCRVHNFEFYVFKTLLYALSYSKEIRNKNLVILDIDD